MVQSALFHDCLALSFWLNVPIIARMGSLFYVTISVDSVLLSFPKLVKIHNLIWLGISKFCSSWIYCWAEIYRKQIIHGWLWPRRAYHPLAIANIWVWAILCSFHRIYLILIAICLTCLILVSYLSVTCLLVSNFYPTMV